MKYIELLDYFEQTEYFFDGRDKIDVHEINSKLDKMMRSYGNEKGKIAEKLANLDTKKIFDILGKD